MIPRYGMDSGRQAPTFEPWAGTMIDHALSYAALGLEVFPLRPDKTPYTTHGMKEATADLATVKAWWDAHPDALIGCRVPIDVLILDIDIRHGGQETFEALEWEFTQITKGRTHWSGRGDGGRHLWFRRPDGPLSVRGLNAWAKDHKVGHAITATKWSCGIDLLHHGHRYTILPPSIHPDTGAPYTWGDSSLDEPPAELPAWLADLLLREPEIPVPATATTREASFADDDSPLDWYRSAHRWTDLLSAHGWRPVGGDGNHDGSRWRHPLATASYSATIKHGCLFVYSPNTPFDETTDGEPRGYTLGRAYAVLEYGGDLAAAARAIRGQMPRSATVRDDWWAPSPPRPALTLVHGDDGDEDMVDQEDESFAYPLELVDWSTFWTRDLNAATWIAEPLIAEGRGHAIFAPGGTGKSLLGLCVVAAVATGRAILNKPAGPRRHVLYLDYEMTDLDLQERLDAMGYGPDIDLSHLHYALLPNLPPLDTREGAIALASVAAAVGAELVVIDTFGRAVEGEENDADTVRNYYRLTGMALKSRGIASLRIDHAGKDAGKGQRGSSAKNDDVDVVWELRKADGGFVAVAKKRRMGWVPETVDISQVDGADGVLTFTCQDPVYPTGTMQTAAWMDAAGVPLGASVRAASAMLRAASDSRPALAQTTTAVVGAALKYRHRRDGAVDKWVDECRNTPRNVQMFGGSKHSTKQGDDPLKTLAETPAETLRNSAAGLAETFPPPRGETVRSPDSDPTHVVIEGEW